MEKVLVFGEHRNLVGILSEPEGGGGGMPGVLLLNAGLLHRVGPYRLYVELARGLEASGFHVLRFDGSGLGDSAMPHDSRDYDERSRDDITDAMDLLTEKKGIETFVLVGLCSGADNAHAVASVDERVTGVVMLDGFTYPTLRFYLKDYAPYMINPVRLAWFLAKCLGRAVARLIPALRASKGGGDVYERTFPPKARVAGELAEMAGRGVRMLTIYSGGIAGYYNYADQFTDMFKGTDFKGLLQLEYIEEANHTYTALSVRRHLMGIIFTWVTDHFAGDAPVYLEGTP
ncbi:alpha/beta fold hydrolase [Desulfoluna butyratoxydans]|uniref:Alpha/beta hydrolase fold-1 n=1 Tax=Desulfoluna butyratoxydans TaxID=231438 RepID=A0A4U8YMR8_9BACT|nr:alpha/beta fold hydrolase [Desulfoluna butyratoxydans]VFQ44459.1 alpha/beta hydrolase fold-1 [Desulfoluna butyratoxydans]